MTTYEIRVDGHLDDHWSAWLGGLTIDHHDDGTSSITAAVADQAQLHGLLAGLRDISATLVSLRVREAEGSAGPLQDLRSIRDDAGGADPRCLPELGD